MVSAGYQSMIIDLEAFHVCILWLPGEPNQPEHSFRDDRRDGKPAKPVLRPTKGPEAGAALELQPFLFGSLRVGAAILSYCSP